MLPVIIAERKAFSSLNKLVDLFVDVKSTSVSNRAETFTSS